MRDVIGEGLAETRRRASGYQQRRLAPGRVKVAALLLAAVALTVLTQSGAAEDPKHGEALLTRHCGACHAIGRSGDSPQRDAPAFRELGQRYPVESLEEALGEGFMSGHPDMPEFNFEADDVGDIIAYLKSIQRN